MSIAIRLSCLFTALFLSIAKAGDIDQPWTRHTIDDSSRGADGTRLADINSDGWIDFTTGWEQGGITRVYVNPGPHRAKQSWPRVTVGKTPNVEDAVFADLDRDGSFDVISCCEGRTRTMFVHWAPAANEYLDEDKWTTTPIPASQDRTQWMFATPADLNGDGRLEILAGGKGSSSELGWWQVPSDARDVKHWTWHPIRPVGWLMSLQAVDVDTDGDLDILLTDRKGPQSGCYWLENSLQESARSSTSDMKWTQHTIGAVGTETMFLSRADINADGLEDMLIATRPNKLYLSVRLDEAGRRWNESVIEIPNTFGTLKSAVAADMDQDGHLEIVFSTEQASDQKMGIGRIVFRGGHFFDSPEFTSISGVDGVKHDLVELVDLDADGDLDVITCEEVRNLGIIWYENPLHER